MISGYNPADLYDLAALLPVSALGSTLIVAPHPDDESLGCGGTIALLQQAGTAVHVVFVSDGTESHPHSQKFPAKKLMELREKEAIAALAILGVNSSQASFMRLKDAQVPGLDHPGFETAVTTFIQQLKEHQPATILAPWRRDPHRDHQAVWHIVDTAISRINKPIQRLEYGIWLWERGSAAALPQEGEVQLWKVDVEPVLHQKQNAIMAHTSQVTRLIDDDPEGFMLSPEVLAHFSGKYELFAEII